MQVPTTKQLDCFCQKCQEASKVTVSIRESPIDKEDLLYSWTGALKGCWLSG